MLLTASCDAFQFGLSIGLSDQVHLIETEGLITQGLRPGGTDCSNRSNRIRYHVFDTSTDTELKRQTPNVQP